MRYVARGRRAARAERAAGVVLASVAASFTLLAGPAGAVAEEPSDGPTAPSAQLPTQESAQPSSERAAGKSGPEPGTLRGGSVAQSGWWSRLNEEPPAENPLLVPPAPPAPGAPAGTLPVAVSAGEVQRVSALEFALAGDIGSEVGKVVVTLRESAEPGTQVNAAAAAVRACAVTESSLVANDNGRWCNVPEHDCKTESVLGKRSADGVWTFDLTTIAADWLAEDRSGAPAVVLVPEVADAEGRPQSYQVAFDGPRAKGVGLLAVVTDAIGGDDDGEGGSDGGSENGGGDPSAPVGGSGGTVDLGGSGSAVDLGGDTGGLGAPEALAPAAGDGSVPAAPVSDAGEGTTTAGTTPVAVSALPWHAGIPRPALFLVPLALGLAYLAMVALGPDAQPTGELRRRGVSRALDRTRAAATQLATTSPKGTR